MYRRQLYAELATTRELVAAAAQRFAVVTAGVDHPRVDTARNRLATVVDALAAAAGGLSSSTRTMIDVVVLAVVGWTTATFTGSLLHLSPGWTIAVTLGALAAVFWPCWRLTNRAAWLVNRRRLASAGSATVAVPPAAPGAEVDVTRSLLAARRTLIATANRELAGRVPTAAARTPAGLTWARQRWVTVYWLSHADVMLCQALDSIEIWADSSARSRP